MKVKHYIDFLENYDPEMKEDKIIEGILYSYEDMKLSEAKEIVNGFIDKLNSEVELKDTGFETDGKRFDLIDFKKMTVGEFVDLDTYVKDIGKGDRFLSVAYRPKGESYEGSDLYKDVMSEIPYEYLVYALNQFKVFREEIADNYDNIYSKQKKSPDKRSNLSSGSQFYEKWGWYSFIYKAAGGDFLKIDEVLSKPVAEFLTFLDFQIGKDQMEIDNINKQRKHR